MPEPKAFLAIERTMAAAMRSQWDKRARELADKLQPLVGEKKWGEAQTVVNQITLDGVVSGVHRKIEEMAVSALLFGAHHAAGSLKDTGLAKGGKLPQEMDHAIAQLVHMVEKDGREYVCKQLHEAIEALKRADDAAHMQKDDIAEADLASNGGLQEPEQAPKRRKLKKSAQPLYIHRDLKNTADLLDWAKSQGFTTTLPPEKMHVTLCYSKTPVSWEAMGEAAPEVTVMEGFRVIEQFGKGAVALQFESPELRARHYELRERGVTSDFPDYRSHVTITYDLPEGMDIELVEPYRGPLIFGPELFEEIKGAGFNPATDLTEEALKWDRLFKAEGSLADKLNAAVLSGGSAPIDLAANLTTSRLISLGFLAEAIHRKEDTYTVNEVLDGRTCPVCRHMHGRTFKTQQQYDRVVQQLSTSDPNALRSLAPWPDQSAAGLQTLYSMSAGDMQGAGYGSPPYHPGCRGFLVLVGSVEEEIPLGGGELAMPDLGGLTLPSFATVEAEQAAAFPAAPVSEQASMWTASEIDRLKWERFDVTDPVSFTEVDAAFEAGEYDKAQDLIDDWKHNHGLVEKEDPERFEGPNAGKKRWKPQTPAGREQDYADIKPDSSSIAFDNGVSNDNWCSRSNA